MINKLSIKSRLVLLHTATMTIIIMVVLSLLFSINSYEISANVQHALKERVNESYNYLRYDNGELSFTADFLKVEDGIYLSAYSEDDLDLLYGKIPFGFAYDLPFMEDEIQSIQNNRVNYFVYDTKVPFADGRQIMIRGIVSIDEAEKDFRSLLQTAIILLPLLIVLTAAGGYIISKRAMAPITRIAATVKKIKEKQDLSQRVDLGQGKDEVYALAATFDDLLDDLDQSIQREKRFSSDVAHELRTPLSVMKMTVDKLINDPKFTEEEKQDIRLLDKKLEQMISMVNQLLLLARAENGRMTIHKTEFNLSDLCLSIVQEYKEKAEKRNILVKANIMADISYEGDETLILRMIINLMDNALKFTADNRSVELDLNRNDNEIIIKVKDEGVGIACDQLDKIFDRFYKSDDSRNKGGHGLGLAMVKEIVKAHGGKIEVKSTLTKGSVFTVLLKI